MKVKLIMIGIVMLLISLNVAYSCPFGYEVCGGCFKRIWNYAQPRELIFHYSEDTGMMLSRYYENANLTCDTEDDECIDGIYIIDRYEYYFDYDQNKRTPLCFVDFVRNQTLDIQPHIIVDYSQENMNTFYLENKHHFDFYIYAFSSRGYNYGKVTYHKEPLGIYGTHYY